MLTLLCFVFFPPIPPFSFQTQEHSSNTKIRPPAPPCSPSLSVSVHRPGALVGWGSWCFAPTAVVRVPLIPLAAFLTRSPGRQVLLPSTPKKSLFSKSPVTCTLPNPMLNSQVCNRNSLCMYEQQSPQVDCPFSLAISLFGLQDPALLLLLLSHWLFFFLSPLFICPKCFSLFYLHWLARWSHSDPGL